MAMLSGWVVAGYFSPELFTGLMRTESPLLSHEKLVAESTAFINAVLIALFPEFLATPSIETFEVQKLLGYGGIFTHRDGFGSVLANPDESGQTHAARPVATAEYLIKSRRVKLISPPLERLFLSITLEAPELVLNKYKAF
jgi:hypothetical protein